MNFNSILTISILSALLSTSTKNIEKSFLQNNPRMLYPLFSSSTHLNISFPAPITFSDQLSPQQAYFLFKKIFSTYTTFEFYSESNLPIIPEEDNFIFKARWSFMNKKNDNQYVFYIYFYLKNETREKTRASPLPSRVKKTNRDGIWKITEIRAEKL